MTVSTGFDVIILLHKKLWLMFIDRLFISLYKLYLLFLLLCAVGRTAFTRVNILTGAETEWLCLFICDFAYTLQSYYFAFCSQNLELVWLFRWLLMHRM